MDFEVSAELRDLQLRLRRFMDDEILPLEKIYYDDAIPPPTIAALRAKLKEQDLWGLGVPKQYGGLGLNNLGSCLVSEEIGKSILGAGFGAPHLIANNVPPALYLCNEEQRKKYLDPVIRGEKKTFFAQTEPGAGSDPGSMQTVAVRQGDNWIINGTKFFISWAAIADFGIAFAVTDLAKRQHGGITCFIIERDQPGFRINRKIQTLGGPGRSPTEIVFDDCVVPDSQRLGEVGQGFVLAQRVLGRNRMGSGGGAVGKAERAVGYGVARVAGMTDRVEAASANGLLADSLVDIHAVRWMAYYGAWKADQGGQVRAESSMVKVFATEMLFRIVERVLRIYGPEGYGRAYPLESMLRNARGSRIVEGSSEIQRMLLARFLFAD